MRRFLLIPLVAALSGTLTQAAGTCRTNFPIELKASGDAIRNGTVTKLDMSWFGIERSPATPVLYTAQITNRDTVLRAVRLVVEMRALPTDPAHASACGTGDGCWIQRQMSGRFEIPAGGTIFKTSNDFYNVGFARDGIEPEQSPFKKLMGKLGYIPSSQVQMRFSVVCANPDPTYYRLRSAPEELPAESRIGSVQSILQDDGTNPTYAAVRAPDPLSPGNTLGGDIPDISSSQPTFLFQSDLASPSIRYPTGQSKFLLYVWEVREGESVTEATSRRPSFSTQTNATVLPYPNNWSPLQMGKTYAWSVQAQLRGPVVEPAPSELRVFRVVNGSQAGAIELSSEQNRLIIALRILLGQRNSEAEDLLTTRIPTLSSLRIDGKSATLEEIESLAAQAQNGKAKLIGIKR